MTTILEGRKRVDYYILLAAVIVDLIVGDPHWYPHPVVIMGWGISWLENKLRPAAKNAMQERILGIVLVLLVVVGTFLAVGFITSLSYNFNYYFGVLVNIWLLSTAVALKGLVQAAQEIYKPLSRGDLELARERVDLIVGRDVEYLDKKGLIRSTIETAAENTNDGILAPLFYAFLGGAPLALAYKAVNTLDSMLGYKNEKYRYFGWAAARLDDLANWPPARITGFFLVLAAFLFGEDGKKAAKIIRRDAAKHPSPNAGIPEAAVAGALNIRLGGLNYYEGRKSFRAYLGDPEEEFKVEQIKRTIKLIYVSTALFVALVVISGLWSVVS